MLAACDPVQDVLSQGVPAHYSEGPPFRRSAILSSKLCIRSPWSGSQAAKPSEAESLLAFWCPNEAKNFIICETAQQFLLIDAMHISAACV